MLTKQLAAVLRRLDHPYKIQDWVSKLTYNTGDETRSALKAYEAKKAHCFEGALLACLALEYHGNPPYMMDLRGYGDDDHGNGRGHAHGLW